MADSQALPPPVTTSAVPPATRPIERGRRIPWPQIAVTLEIVLIIGIWQVLQGNFEVVNKIFLPAPSQIGETLVAMLQPGFEVVRNTPGDVYTHIGASVYRFVTAFAMASVGGIALGLLIGGWFPAQKLIAPFVWALYAMPLIAIRPMTTWWFGFGDNPIIFLVFLAALLPITLNTAAGVSTVDPVLYKTAKVFGASKLQTYRNIVLPSTVPFILTGLRLGIIIGWIILLISEFLGASRGFGQLLAVGQSRFKPDIVFATIVIIVILSVGSVRIVGFFEDRVSSWRPDNDR